MKTEHNVKTVNFTSNSKDIRLFVTVIGVKQRRITLGRN